jgi:hypothetical protein
MTVPEIVTVRQPLVNSHTLLPYLEGHMPDQYEKDFARTFDIRSLFPFTYPIYNRVARGVIQAQTELATTQPTINTVEEAYGLVKQLMPAEEGMILYRNEHGELATREVQGEFEYVDLPLLEMAEQGQKPIMEVHTHFMPKPLTPRDCESLACPDAEYGRLVSGSLVLSPTIQILGLATKNTVQLTAVEFERIRDKYEEEIVEDQQGIVWNTADEVVFEKQLAQARRYEHAKLVEFGREMNVKFYYSNNLVDFREFTA